jgi:hypothetical protein
MVHVIVISDESLLIHVIVAVPTPIPVTSPALDTLAINELVVVHITPLLDAFSGRIVYMRYIV